MHACILYVYVCTCKLVAMYDYMYIMYVYMYACIMSVCIYVDSVHMYTVSYISVLGQNFSLTS